MNDGTFFSVEDYSQPRNTGPYTEECPGLRMALVHHHGRAYAKKNAKKSLFGYAFLCNDRHCHGELLNRRLWPLQSVSSYIHKESIYVNYQVIEVSFDQALLQHNIKKRPLTLGQRRMSALVGKVMSELQQHESAECSWPVLCWFPVSILVTLKRKLRITLSQESHRRNGLSKAV